MLYQKDSCSATCCLRRKGVSSEQDWNQSGWKQPSPGGASGRAGAQLPQLAQHRHSILPSGTGVTTGTLTAFRKAIVCPLENKALILSLVFQPERDVYTQHWIRLVSTNITKSPSEADALYIFTPSPTPLQACPGYSSFSPGNKCF